MTDSPFGDYVNSTNSKTTLITPIDLTDAASAFLYFEAKWDIEADYDFAKVLISTDGNTFTPLCGQYSEPGTQEQGLNVPVYDGVQNAWVSERICLDDYVGQLIYIQFEMGADNFINGDGFYFDDVRVETIQPNPNTSLDQLAGQLAFSVYPNPFSEQLLVEIDEQKGLDNTSLELRNTLGQLVQKQDQVHLISGMNRLGFDTSNLSSGMYILNLRLQDGSRLSRKVIKQ
ncbi:MAG: T9SS type A sorting domain-containing protein [Bacteroidota bacterium]